MALPDWRSYTGGTMKRAALWLLSEVGEGNVFTKEQLRAAFPGVAQIDRRVRDLRDDGWVIHTSRDDVTLGPDEQRLAVVGGPVWDSSYRRKATRSLTSKERQAVFASDDYCCAACGVAGGEPYPDQPLRKAKLTVARGSGGESGGEGYVTVCDRCHAGVPQLPNLGEVLTAVDALHDDERARLAAWLLRGRRTLSSEERILAACRRLPADERREVVTRVSTRR